MTEDKPDYILSMGTAMQNIRTSYLGGVNNAEDAYLNFSDYDWAWNNDPYNPVSYLADYNVLERDVTHCSYELARYSSTEVSAAYEKIKGYFARGLIFSSEDAKRIRTAGEYAASASAIQLIAAETGCHVSEFELI